MPTPSSPPPPGPSIAYHGRTFRGVENSASGEVGEGTRFHYRQRDDVVWATYEGGGVRLGTLVAKVGADGALDMRYAHVNADGELRTGTCRSVPEVLADGRLRLHERWRWTDGDRAEGTSIVEEIEAGPEARALA